MDSTGITPRPVTPEVAGSSPVARAREALLIASFSPVAQGVES